MPRRDSPDKYVRRPEDWFPVNKPTPNDVLTAIDDGLAAVDINTTAPITGGGNLSGDLTLALNGTKAEFNAACSDGDFLYVGDDVGSQVSDDPYGPSWDGITDLAPSQNAVYDKIESLAVGAQQAAIADAAGGTEIATINAILAAMRAHGLIAT